jgi:hypothetical protein
MNRKKVKPKISRSVSGSPSGRAWMMALIAPSSGVLVYSSITLAR